MFLSQRVRRGLAASATLAATLASVLAPSAAHADPATSSGLAAINHIVVIYEENHSFDNLFGLWEGVHGLPHGNDHATQNGADGKALPCLLQNDVNLTSPDPLAATCHGTSNSVTVDSAFDNKPFLIDQYVKPADKTCPAPGVFAANGVKKDSAGALPGGCTRDLVHRYYQEQYQINGGKQDRYTLGSDAMGLTMGYYDTKGLPIYEYLHASGAPNYAVDDNFFQGAFGGSFLNHQFLVAAAAPVFPNAVHDGGATDLHSIVGPDGEPKYYPLQTPVAGVVDGALTQAANSDGSCAVPAGKPTAPAGTVCGDFAVNTIQPTYQPFAPGTAAAKQLPPLTNANIGDNLSAKNVDWAWYSGGWSNANGDKNGPGWTNGDGSTGKCTDPQVIANAVFPNCPDALFQFHHQPFNYFKTYAPGTDARKAHLRDEAEFIDAAKAGKLKPVSFVKPVGEENEHPGYASEDTGSSHLVELLKGIEGGPQAADTMVIVTYDEFGGQWDHVSPPKGDKWGPGTRIPALVISPKLAKSFAVDHTSYDTTSILATIEHRFGLQPLGADTRDGKVADLSAGLTTGGTGGGSGLPITGTSVTSLLLIGLGLLVAGGAATVIARRRRVG